MKILKPVLIFLAFFSIAVFVRWSIHARLPRVYSAVWGGGAQRSDGGAIGTGSAVPAPAQSKREVPPPSGAGGRGGGGNQQDELYATGVLRGRGKIILCLSDGSVRTMDDNYPTTRLTAASRTYVDFDGKRYWVMPRKENTPAPVKEKDTPLQK